MAGEEAGGPDTRVLALTACCPLRTLAELWVLPAQLWKTLESFNRVHGSAWQSAESFLTTTGNKDTTVTGTLWKSFTHKKTNHTNEKQYFPPCGVLCDFSLYF